MNGTIYYAVSLPPGVECDKNELVFDNREEALKICKKFKGARFKSFTDKNEAIQFTFTEQVIENASAITQEAVGEKLHFSAPSPQEVLQFRKIIEAGNCPAFLEMVWKNPRFLISSGDTPAMVREPFRYHALLFAAFKKQFEICQMILDTICNTVFIGLLYPSDTAEVRHERMLHLLDLYLNTSDKFLLETPLHFASKFGCADIVELLVSYAECDRERKNSNGHTPADIICHSCKEKSTELENRIRALLGQRFFIPVLRPADYSCPPVVGQPWSPDINKTLSKSGHSILSSPLVMADELKSPAESELVLQAYAGPMSPKDADIFYKQLKTPPVPKRLRNSLFDEKITPKGLFESRLTDIEKGIERAGRNLARDLNVPWCEYWNFLEDFCDISSTEGLEKLENYLQRQKELDFQQPLSQEINSPISDLCEKLNALHLYSPPPIILKEREEFFTPPSSPSSPYELPSKFYILGSQPSKIDVDVLRALEVVYIDQKKFPNVFTWKDNMKNFDEDQLMRLKTPLRIASCSNSPTAEVLSSPSLPTVIKRLNSPRKIKDSPVIRLTKRFENI